MGRRVALRFEAGIPGTEVVLGHVLFGLFQRVTFAIKISNALSKLEEVHEGFLEYLALDVTANCICENPLLSTRWDQSQYCPQTNQ